MAFNVAGGERVSINQLLGLIQEITGVTDIAPNHVASRAGDVRDSFASIERAREVLGFEPQTSLREGLRLTHASMLATRPV